MWKEVVIVKSKVLYCFVGYQGKLQEISVIMAGLWAKNWIQDICKNMQQDSYPFDCSVW